MLNGGTCMLSDENWCLNGRCRSGDGIDKLSNFSLLRCCRSMWSNISCKTYFEKNGNMDQPIIRIEYIDVYKKKTTASNAQMKLRSAKFPFSPTSISEPDSRPSNQFQFFFFLSLYLSSNPLAFVSYRFAHNNSLIRTRLSIWENENDAVKAPNVT